MGFISYNISHALTFDAELLSTSNTTDFVAKVFKWVVIHGYTFENALEKSINDCSSMGKHTGVVHLTPGSVTKFIWAHKEIQPWGEKLPLQCPQCGVLEKWISITLNDPPGYLFRCVNVNCGKEGGKADGKRVSEGHEFHVLRPKHATLLSSGGGAGWLKVVIS